MLRAKGVPEKPQGRFAALPDSVQDSPAWQQASGTVAKLVMALIRQHTGSNNGHLNASMAYLSPRGWSSADVLHEAIGDAEALNLIVETRKGGLGRGASLYAVTWLPISSFAGLDLPPEGYRRGAFATLSADDARRALRERVQDRKAQRATRAKNKIASPKSGTARSGKRINSAPESGLERSQVAPESGTKTATFKLIAAPQSGRNERLPMVRSRRGGDVPSLQALVADASDF